MKKSKMIKILNPMKIQKGKSLIKWQNQTTKHIKRMDNNCHIPDLIQAFSNVLLFNYEFRYHKLLKTFTKFVHRYIKK